jgi:large repetitive protein
MPSAKPASPKLRRGHPQARGLRGAWLFAEGSGPKAYDLSGYDQHGTLAGMADPGTSASGWWKGQHGHALAFDGTNDYAQTASDSGWRRTGPFTISAWVKPSSTADSEVLCWIGSGSAGWDLSVTSGKYRGSARALGGLDLLSTVTSVAAGAWVMVTYAWAPSGQALYVNGAQDNTAASTLSAISLPAAAFAAFGTRNDTPGSLFYGGLLDGVVVFDRALSANEVAALYADTFAAFRPRRLVFAPAAAPAAAPSLVFPGSGGGLPGLSFGGGW